MIEETHRVSASQARFDQFAQRYVDSETHAKAPELSRLVELACPEPEWVILDTATGGGHTGLAFAPHVRRVIATDIAAGMLSAAREFILGTETANVLFSFAQSERLPFIPSCFDLVTCRIAAHHFRDVSRFAAECARVLRTGGILLVQDQCLPENPEAARYINRFERLRDPSHRRSFSASEWEAIFKRAGLQVSHREIIDKKHNFESWAERQNCSQAVKEKLVKMVREAPDEVLAWMRPSGFGGPHAVFDNHHILIAGRKGKIGDLKN